MDYIVKNRDHNKQMHNIFHHSLIKMVVMNQLQHKNIPWDAFIANEVFTTAPIHHEHNIPSSSHHDIRALSSERDVEAAGTKMIDIEPFSFTYQRAHRHVFASHGVKGAMPSSSENRLIRARKMLQSISLLRRRTNMKLSRSFS